MRAVTSELSETECQTSHGPNRRDGFAATDQRKNSAERSADRTRRTHGNNLRSTRAEWLGHSLAPEDDGVASGFVSLDIEIVLEGDQQPIDVTRLEIAAHLDVANLSSRDQLDRRVATDLIEHIRQRLVLERQHSLLPGQFHLHAVLIQLANRIHRELVWYERRGIADAHDHFLRLHTGLGRRMSPRRRCKQNLYRALGHRHF